MRHALVKIVPVFLLFAAVADTAHADVAAGAKIAQRWCVELPRHQQRQVSPVPQGPPTFITIAKSGMSADQLHAFLSHPHGAMPDLSLTRTEIDDLIAYIQSLR